MGKHFSLPSGFSVWHIEEGEVILLLLLGMALFAWAIIGLQVAINLFDERSPDAAPPGFVGVALVWPLGPFIVAGPRKLA